MDPRNVQLVQESFGKLSKLHDGLADTFASEFNSIVSGPSAISPERQRRLLGVIAATVPSLDAPEQVLTTIARDYCDDTLDPQDFEYAGNALLRTLKKSLGAEFSYDLWQAWVDALCTLSRVLSEIAAARPSRTAPAAA
jgi:hemoglobin-like flavoprotein